MSPQRIEPGTCTGHRSVTPLNLRRYLVCIYVVATSVDCDALRTSISGYITH
jgi:hypothetical protein